MKNTVFALFALLIGALLLTSCCGMHATKDQAACQGCTCSAAGGEGCACSAAGGAVQSAGCEKCGLGKDGKTGWCDACQRGYANGKEYQCQACFLAATGAGPACTKCQTK
ncbi:MAG: hypothetical protein HY812_18685 [Planctomycetes bacterium]|nr:hypothetical protein [Planctomycetota bacterium]